MSVRRFFALFCLSWGKWFPFSSVFIFTQKKIQLSFSRAFTFSSWSSWASFQVMCASSRLSVCLSFVSCRFSVESRSQMKIDEELKEMKWDFSSFLSFCPLAWTKLLKKWKQCHIANRCKMIWPPTMSIAHSNYTHTLLWMRIKLNTTHTLLKVL